MREDDRTYVRPRGEAWGNAAQRAVLHAIAEDIARRSSHRVAAIEVLRSDNNLEFVAIAGNPEARHHLLGRAAPLAMDKIVAFGTHIDGWVHIPEEQLDDDTRAWMAEYGHTPDLPEPAVAEAWRAEDRLVRLLTNEDGELRATLYLDEPLDGMRPTRDSIAAVNAEAAVLYDAVVSLVERELYGEQVRMVAQARAARQSVRPGLDLDDFLRELSAAMAEAMEVESIDVLLLGQPAPALEPWTRFFEEHMRRVWLRRGHLVVDPDPDLGRHGGCRRDPRRPRRGHGAAGCRVVAAGPDRDGRGVPRHAGTGPRAPTPRGGSTPRSTRRPSWRATSPRWSSTPA